MAHVIEAAPTGRAKCRGCGDTIAKATIRFGERLPNAFGEGEMTLWFHPICAAYKRPESVLEVLDDPDVDPADLEDPLRDRLRGVAEASTAHRRLPRLDLAERAPTGRARCRSCREMIAKDNWRIRLVFFEGGRFESSGFIHVTCVAKYAETNDVLDRLCHFSSLADQDVAELELTLRSATSR